jgi:Holliday junction resolvase RusA-like endonuclease
MRGKHPSVIKSQKALDYEYTSSLQIQKQLGAHRTFLGPIAVEFHVWYGSRRPDLDISLIQDILEKNGVYANDRQVVELHAFKYLDKKNPRLIARISELKDNPMA